MKAVQTGQAHARRAAGSNGNGHGLVSELDALRATCQRQAHVLDKLYAAVSALHRGAAALKAENAELRAAVATTPQSAAHAAPGVNGGAPRDRVPEISVPLDRHAPGAARKAVAEHVRHRVSAAVLLMRIDRVRVRHQQRVSQRRICRCDREDPRRAHAHGGVPGSRRRGPRGSHRAPGRRSRRRPRIRTEPRPNAQPTVGRRARRRLRNSESGLGPCGVSSVAVGWNRPPEIGDPGPLRLPPCRSSWFTVSG